MLSNVLLNKGLGEPFQCTGIWWLPSESSAESPNELDSESYAYGNLSFNRGSLIKLDIMSIGAKFSSDIVAAVIGDSKEPTTQKLIHGFTVNREKITLYDCLFGRVNLASDSREAHLKLVSDASVLAHAALIGAHFDKPEDIKFKTLWIKYSHLAKWLGFRGFSGSLDELLDEVQESTQRSTSPADIEDYRISIDTGVTTSLAGDTKEKMIVDQGTVLHIESKRAIDFKKCRNIVRYVQNFLSLMLMEPAYPLAFEGQAGSDSPKINLLYDPLGSRNSPESIDEEDMLFTYKKISYRFEAALKKMLGDPDIKPIHDLFFADFYNPPTFIEDRFLSKVQAIEAFHRRVYADEGSYIPTDAYRKMVRPPLEKAIDDLELEEKFSDGLKARIKYGNEISLRSRLNHLLNEFGLMVLGPDVTNKDVKSFVDDVVNTRNYYTHYDNSLEGKALTNRELMRVNPRLELFLIILLLYRMGIPKDIISEAVRSNRKITNLRAQNAI
jgi:hypothetical protein